MREQLERSRELAIAAARAASEKQANDITVLEVRELIGITDHFVIASGATDRQVRAIAEAVEEALRPLDEKPIRREGERDFRWVLLDYADIVVHVFHQEDRTYYDIERLWRDAPKIDWEQDAPRARSDPA